MKFPHLTLGEYVFQLVRDGKIDSPEWENLIKIYTKEHIRDVYKKEVERQKKEAVKQNNI